jgi:2-haloacid dehalogenase
MLVAAHNHDLLAARALGLATAWVARPREYGPSQTPPPGPAAEYDVIASDIGELADRLGA